MSALADLLGSPLLASGLAGLLVALIAMHWAPTDPRPVDRESSRPSPPDGPRTDARRSEQSSPTGPRRLARPFAWSARRRNERAPVRPDTVAAWLDELSRSVRRGVTVRETLLTVVPVDATLTGRTDHLRHVLGRGATVAEGCVAWADRLRESRRPVPDLVTVASILTVASTSGGSVAEPLDRLAATMRSRASAELERGAQAAQATMSARVLTLLPVGVLALLLVTDDSTRRVAASATGTAVIVVGLGLNALGGWWMRRIIGGAA